MQESGLIRLLEKQVCQQWHPEFESRSHRHQNLNSSQSNITLFDNFKFGLSDERLLVGEAD